MRPFIFIYLFFLSIQIAYLDAADQYIKTAKQSKCIKVFKNDKYVKTLLLSEDGKFLLVGIGANCEQINIWKISSNNLIGVCFLNQDYFPEKKSNKMFIKDLYELECFRDAIRYLFYKSKYIRVIKQYFNKHIKTAVALSEDNKIFFGFADGMVEIYNQK